MLEGLLIKGYNGFYYVEAEGALWTCSLRGRFRIKEQNFLPGDRVRFTPLGFPKGVIEAVLERKNELLRPPIANVSRVLITFAATEPAPNFLLLDRVLIQVMEKGIEPVICFNKVDLVTPGEAEALARPYTSAHFPVLLLSAAEGYGLSELEQAMKGHLSVFAGPSGVGKSSLINSLYLEFQLKTGDLSKKVARGRHTTRRVELLKLSENTYLADTPGFSNLYLPDHLRKEDLLAYYPEFQAYASKCRFTSCLHLKEPDCAVIQGLENGELDWGRYERYQAFFAEIKERERKY